MSFFKDLELICKINSYTKNKEGVDKVSSIMQNWYEELGFKTEIFKREHIGNHILLKSKKTNGKKILFLGHNDTVFPPGSFDSYFEDEEFVYGPGVCDMKGGNIVALEALRRVKAKRDIFNIDILLVSDEETGSDDSKFVTLDIAKNYDYCFVFEAAGKNLEVVTSRKGVGTWTIYIKGKASHAGVRYNEGVDANLEASFKLQKLVALTNLSEGISVNVGKIEGGIGANTISPNAKLIFEARWTKNKHKSYLLKEIDKIVNTSFVKGTKATLDGLVQRDVMEETEKQLEFLKKLEQITNTKIPKESRGGVSDANYVASSRVITLDGFGPFGDGDHTDKERALKSSFYQRIDMVEKIINYFLDNNCSIN